ncbi:MAG: rhomboid family intramembrane serine protease [Bacteroidota bacterium]
MIPLSDDNSGHTIKPYVNYVLIALNIFVFVYFQGFGTNSEFTNGYSTVPAEILTATDIITDGQHIIDPYTGQDYFIPGLMPTLIPVWLTLITSMFMHGGIAHLGGNMLYLWIFGDNIENRLGHKKYLLFYLTTGVIASLSHVFLTLASGQNSLIPSLGASGAISGIMGGYIILFPLQKVNVFVVFTVLRVPALIALGFWIFFQVVSGLGVLDGESDGVAYAAHIGGFIAGLLLIKVFDKKVVKTKSSYFRRL